jgi:hypothetical protein
MKHSRVRRARGVVDRSLGSARQRRYLFSLLVCLLVIGTLLANSVAAGLGERFHLSYDLTSNAAYRPGDETKAVLRNLDADVEIFVLAAQDTFTSSPYLVQARRMMEQYPGLSPHVRLSYVDYAFDPTFASRYPSLTLSEGNVLVVSGDRVKQLQLAQLFNYTSGETGSLSIQSSRAEEALTSAILFVTGDRQLRVAVLTGNGVASMPAFGQLLEDNNFQLSDVNLTLGALDDSFDIALLLAPEADLAEDVLKKVDAFLYNNGAYGKTLLFTSAVTQGSLPNMNAFLKEWGVVVGDGAVFETTAARTYRYQPYYPVAEYVDEAYRDRLKDSASPVLMPLARPMELLFATRDAYYNEVLLEFSDTSGVRPADAVESFAVDQATRRGPMPALVLASKRIRGTTGVTQFRSNLIVSASTGMLDAFSIQNTSLSNSDYLLS